MSNLPETAQPPAVSAPDEFETTLTKREQQLTALKAVKQAQDILRITRAREARAVERAEEAVVDAMVAADKVGAYALLPDNVRPAIPARAAS